MPATLPKTVTVGGRRLRVVVAELEDDWGRYEHDAGVVTISTMALAKRSTTRETLRHEILHAALQISGVGFCERYDEESVVRCLESLFWPAWDRIRKRL